MVYADTVVDLMGDTPLVRLHKVAEGLAPLVLAKVEYFNPGGSVKDRIALRMVEAAEADGRLKPGGTIVEPTSGNTGVGLALVAQQRGYRCVFVCPDKVSEDKRNVLKAYGAEVVVCPTAVPPEHPDSYYSVSDRLARELEGGWKPDQYSNPEGPASHYATTGPEIWRDTAGRVTHFVTGVGTGGTISGTGRYLKEVSVGRSIGPVRVVGRRPGGLGLLRGRRPALPRRGRRRGLLADGLRPGRPRRDHRRLRRRLVPHDAPAGPRGGPARRRLLRDGRGGGATGGRALRTGRRGRRPAPGRRPRLPLEDLQRPLDGVLRLPPFRRQRDGGGRAAQQDGGLARPRAHAPVRDRPRRHRDPARLQRLADARGQGRATRAAGRGRRVGERA